MFRILRALLNLEIWLNNLDNIGKMGSRTQDEVCFISTAYNLSISSIRLVWECHRLCVKRLLVDVSVLLLLIYCHHIEIGIRIFRPLGDG